MTTQRGPSKFEILPPGMVFHSWPYPPCSVFLSNLTDTDLSMALGSIVSGVPLVKSQRVEFDAVHAVMLFDH